MIAYHWAPSTRRQAIHREGMRIGCAPHVNFGVPPYTASVIVKARRWANAYNDSAVLKACDEAAKDKDGKFEPPDANPHISMAKTPSIAWMLSGLHMLLHGLTPESKEWDLWQIDLTGIRYRRYYPGGDELLCLTDIPPSALTLVAHRPHVERLT